MGQKTILIVDDEVELVKLLADRLKANGYKIEMAHDGQQALKKLKKIEPDLIILDLNMPKMSGVEFYQKIYDFKKRKAAVSGFGSYSTNQCKRIFNDFYVDGFISKPFESHELLKEVEIIMGSSKKDRSKKPFSKRVVIVDSNEESLQNISSVFLKAGHRVDSAVGGVKGIEKIATILPDAALINLGTTDIPGDVIIFRLQRIKKTRFTHYFLYVHRDFEHEYKQSVLKNFGKKSGIAKVIEYSWPEDLLEEVTQFYKDLESDSTEDSY